LFFLIIFAKSLKQLTMKFAYKSIVAALAFSTVFVFSCKEDDGGGGGGERPGQALSGTWEQLDANDITGPAAADFDGFTLSITAAASGVTYVTNSATNGNPNVFPTQGSFEVEASDNFTSGASITRLPDDVVIDNVKVSADGKKLDMAFTISTDGSSGGRYQGIDGQYTFSLTKKE
jgi:hypothetical protein